MLVLGRVTGLKPNCLRHVSTIVGNAPRTNGMERFSVIATSCTGALQQLVHPLRQRCRGIGGANGFSEQETVLSHEVDDAKPDQLVVQRERHHRFVGFDRRSKFAPRKHDSRAWPDDIVIANLFEPVVVQEGQKTKAPRGKDSDNR